MWTWWTRHCVLTTGSEAWVYEVAPVTVFGFGKGEFTQTRWRYPG